ALGYFAYDLVRLFEHLPVLAENDENLPEMAIGIYHVIVVIDHVTQSTSLVYLEHSSQAMPVVKEWLNLIKESLDAPSNAAEATADQRLVSGALLENMSQVDYRAKFDKVRQYTIEGDCYQVNLAKQFSTPVRGNAWATYSHLRSMSPAPYGAFMNLPFAQVLSNSPESFIRCRDNDVVTSPIKGTAVRDHSDSRRDRAIAKELLASSKDRAENLMIVDLMRNDLSKCCELGSVKVPKLFSLHSFANVHHLISTISGRLKRGIHAVDLMKSCFPGGSITGAPKIRAMEIIEELEPDRRGLYCGSIAYIGMDGNLETSIAIRTITLKDGIARFSAGGGLVIDSVAEEEYQELLDKASMMTAALRN
ncbi:MAG: aminodeoxychorismate synthase component I, partial [Arenicella sp.]|nr:aminodeoxychorismate synthase component I [Arenicella sp.]